MARNIDIFMSNAAGQTIQVCARANANCGSWTLINNPCQLTNNPTNILPGQTGRVSLNANTNDNICLALWDGPSIIANTPPTRTIELPITSNSSGFEIQWSSGVLRLIRTLCMTSVPANISSGDPIVYYQNNTFGTVLVCIDSIFGCTDQTRGNNNCGPNAIAVTPGQLFRAPIANFRTALCIASWLNPDFLPGTAPPTNITTIGPDPSISAILINVSPIGIFSSTTYYTCDPTTGPPTTVIVHNCYNVTMTINQIIDGVPIVVPTTAPLTSMTSATIRISQGALIRLIDLNGIRVSNPYIVPVGSGPSTVFFKSDGTNNSTSCGITPFNPSVTITNCNNNFDAIVEVLDINRGLWVNYIDPTINQSIIIPKTGSRTVSLPVDTNIRLNYIDNNLSQSFAIPNQATVSVYFLPDGIPSTSQICPVLTPPTGGALFGNSNNGTTAGLIRTNGTTAGLIRTNGTTTGVIRNNGTTTGVIRNNGTTFVGRTNGTTASATSANGTLVDIVNNKVTINNCFDSNLNVQISIDNGTNWGNVANTSVNSKSSKVVSILRGLRLRLANSNETTTSGTFTVPNTATSTVFFQANGNVSTSTCDEENRAGFFITIIVVIIIIIIILILLFAFAPKAKPEAGTSSVTHITQG